MPGFGLSFAVQLVIYLALWAWDDYLAFYLSLIFGCICLFVLLISLVVELIERTRINRRYFGLILGGVIAPLLAFIIFSLIGGGMSWLEQ